MSVKGFKWFVGEFLPSLEARMTNPKYPNSCILTEKQADVCCKYMKSEQHTDNDYRWVFTTYHLTVGNKSYMLSSKGSYNFLSVRNLDEEKLWYELEKKKGMISQLVKTGKYNKAELEAMSVEEVEQLFDKVFEDDI